MSDKLKREYFNDDEVMLFIKGRYPEAYDVLMKHRMALIRYAFKAEEKDVLLAFAKITGFQLPF